MRKPGPRSFSIERLFADVRAALPEDVQCRVRVCRYASKGLVRRAYSVAEAAVLSDIVNHITGDVHFLALGLPDSRTVLTVHDCGGLHRLSGLRRAVLKLFWFTWPIRRARVVTTVSEATRREVLALTSASPEKVRVVHNPVSTEFHPLPRAFPVGALPRILMLGTSPNKNLERMAEALAGVPCTAELVGKPLPTQSEAFACRGVALSALGNVSTAEVRAAYERCDLVLFASTFEGFGLPILEAQAVERPVVTSRCSSMPEVAGDGACLVDPQDVRSIREGLLRVIGDSAYREDLIARGRRNVARFSAARIAAEYAAIYREVAAG